MAVDCLADPGNVACSLKTIGEVGGSFFPGFTLELGTLIIVMGFAMAVWVIGKSLASRI